MRAIIQNVNKASIVIGNATYSGIGKGIVVYLGIAQGDKESDIHYIANKVLELRIFANDGDKFDLSLSDIKGELLVISQFTLFADLTKGRRPYFGKAESPDRAEEIYNKFITEVSRLYNQKSVKSGKFGAKMTIEQENLGPVTLILDSYNE
ncbi:MAG: D-aminoacyl-tRNA deacylase [Patescibacteria group bacterium]|nr:D-tyrosyl-tRNA(Tyr) deacylase [Patescibacteria group bacterium]